MKTSSALLRIVETSRSSALGVLLSVTLLALLAILGGCTPGDRSGDVATLADKLPEEPLTAADLSPTIREVGGRDRIPSRIVVELALPSRPEGYEEREKVAVLQIEPRVEGSLAWTGPSTLEFTPERGFKPATSYRVELEGVWTAQGLLEAPARGAWTRSFTTPEFRLVDVGVLSLNEQAHKAEILLTFSGPFKDGDLPRNAFTIQGQPLASAAWRREPRNPTLARAILTDPRLTRDAAVELNLPPVVRSAANPDFKAPPTVRSLKLSGEPTWRVLAALRREGATGHYLEIVCDDDAVEGWDRYWTDPDDYEWFEVSRRCTLPPDRAAEMVRVDPPVPFTVTPGPAGFRILGDFSRGAYTVSIEAGARSEDGARLAGPWSAGFSVPARSPRVSFLSKGRYLPRNAWKNLGIQHLNLRAAALTVRQIRPENLVFWMSDTNETATPRTADVILKSHLLFKLEPDVQGTTWLDVGTLLPKEARGVFELEIAGGGSADRSRILLTDMSLLAKRSSKKPDEPWPSEVLAWVVDMHDGSPLAGAEVKLIRPSGFTMARCQTDRLGACRLEVPTDGVDTTPPFALVATKGDDLTYLKFDELKDELSEEQISGESWFSDTPYRAASYTDRGVYRPGDTAHFVSILRGRDALAPPRDMPVQIKLLDPRGKALRTDTLRTNEAGVVATDWRFEAFATTGRYRAFLTVGKETVGEYGFNVEEFVPERMRVTASSSVPGALLHEAVPVSVEASYLFGGSAAGSRYEVACEILPAAFVPKGLSNYGFGLFSPRAEKPRAITLGSVSGELDDEGKGTLQCPKLGAGIGPQGASRLEARVSVFEGGSGRTTVGQTSIPLHPERYYVGLRSGAMRAEAGRSFTVEGVVVDWEGRLVDAVSSVKVEFFRLDAQYNFWWMEDESAERFERLLRPVGDGGVEAVPVSGGKFQLQVTPGSDGDGYLVRVTAGATRTDLQLDGAGRSYWWAPSESRVDQTPRPMKPTPVVVKAPERVRVGEKARVEFTAPYKGRALLAVETWKVVAWEWMDVNPGEQSWTFKVDEFSPNVYVSAFVIKDPYLDSPDAFMPDRAFGVASVRVEPEAFTQAVKLEVPKEVRSNASFTARLELGAVPVGTYATVAAVDEGILSLTRFKSPDPIATIFARRALGVESFETLGWTLLLPPMGNSSRTGGDEGGAEGRVQPVKPVALWSGLLPVPESGRLDVKFDVPQYRGALRVMAVVAGPKRVGSASAEVTVRDPLVLQTTLPRFLTRGDEAQVPVFVTNLSGAPQKVTLAMHVENLPWPGLEAAEPDVAPVTFTGAREKTLDLKDGQSATAVFRVKATASTGAARFHVSAKAGNLESVESLDVPFEAAGPRGRKVQKLTLAEGDTDLKPHLQGWVPTSEQTNLWVTTNPYGEVFDHLSYLIQYPHGCIEQTTSTTRPLLYVSKLLSSVDPALVARASVEDRVMSGIQRVFSMQTSEGGFAYWPGSDEPNYWGTAYATHMLLDARKAGYEVPAGRLDEALDWMDRLMSARSSDNDAIHGEAFRYGHAYLHYVLALNGKGRTAEILGLIEDLGKSKRTDDEKAEHLFLLKAALYQAGDRRYEKDLKNPDVSPLKKDRRNNWGYYSDLRRRGFMLAILEDLFPKDPATEKLAQLVAAGLSGQRSSGYTTQELVWGVTGLGKRLEGEAASFSSPRLLVNGKERAPRPRADGSKSQDVTWAVPRLSEARDVKLALGNKSDGNVYLLLSSVGVRENDDFPYGGRGLSLTRTYLYQDGTEVETSEGSHALGDVVYVRIDLENTLGARINNIALIDRLPAAWEIENPRLGRGVLPDWIDADTLWTADYMNLRDDRVEVFGGLDTGARKSVVYTVRAVTSGTFMVPPVEAEAMYDPDVWARSQGGTLEISGPWAKFLL
jgi:hypothetical protein